MIEMQLTKNKTSFIIGAIVLVCGTFLVVAMPNADLRSYWFRFWAVYRHPELRSQFEFDIPLGVIIAVWGFFIVLVAGIDFLVSRLWHNEEN